MCQLDPLLVDLFFDCIDIMLSTITRLIDDSLSSGKFSDVFKEAIVKPLLKKCNLDPNDLKNYRPVSKLPFLQKKTILEKVVLLQIEKHLQINSLS